jgi:hypothetical protein
MREIFDLLANSMCVLINVFSLLIAWFVGWMFFEGMYAVSWAGMGIVAAALFTISLVIGEAAQRRVMGTSPAVLLRRGLD